MIKNIEFWQFHRLYLPFTRRIQRWIFMPCWGLDRSNSSNGQCHLHYLFGDFTTTYMTYIGLDPNIYTIIYTITLCTRVHSHTYVWCTWHVVHIAYTYITYMKLHMWHTFIHERSHTWNVLHTIGSLMNNKLYLIYHLPIFYVSVYTRREKWAEGKKIRKGKFMYMNVMCRMYTTCTQYMSVLTLFYFYVHMYYK